MDSPEVLESTLGSFRETPPAPRRRKHSGIYKHSSTDKQEEQERPPESPELSESARGPALASKRLSKSQSPRPTRVQPTRTQPKRFAMGPIKENGESNQSVQ